MGNCWRKGEPFNPGAGLDKVVASAEPACLLYTMANFKKGGQLIDAFNKGGSTGVSFFFIFFNECFHLQVVAFRVASFSNKPGSWKGHIF